MTKAPSIDPDRVTVGELLDRYTAVQVVKCFGWDEDSLGSIVRQLRNEKIAYVYAMLKSQLEWAETGQRVILQELPMCLEMPITWKAIYAGLRSKRIGQKDLDKLFHFVTGDQILIRNTKD